MLTYTVCSAASISMDSAALQHQPACPVFMTPPYVVYDVLHALCCPFANGESIAIGSITARTPHMPLWHCLARKHAQCSWRQQQCDCAVAKPAMPNSCVTALHISVRFVCAGAEATLPQSPPGPSIEEFSSKLHSKLEEVSSKLDSQLEEVSSKLDSQLHSKLEEVSSKLDSQLEEVSSKLDSQLHSKLEEVSSKLDDVATTLADVQQHKRRQDQGMTGCRAACKSAVQQWHCYCMRS
jgi:hypothetical protein